MNDSPIPILTLRKKIETALDDSRELRLLIAHIETQVAATQERIYEEMKEIAQSIKGIVLFQEEIEFIKNTLRNEEEQLEKAKIDSARLLESIETIAKQVLEIEELKKKILRDKIIVKFNTFFLMAIALMFIIHILMT